MEDAIKQFRGITGLGSDDEAKMWLEMAGGDVSIAMGLFFNDGATTTTSSSTKKKEKDENEIVWGSSRKPSGKVLEAWRQGFVFAEKFKGAIVQLKNGPCGVIAVVQALVLSRRLSEREKSSMFETLFHASVTDDELAFVLSSIILKCRDDGDATQAGIAIWKDTFEKTTLKTSKDGVQALVRENISMFRNEFGMLRLVYSMVLSRGVNQIQKDLNDDTESPLIGSSRGLCSFELMSLLLRGVANGDIGAFNQVTRAPQDWNRNDVLGGIGLLSSEFERRVGVQICNALKIPKAPIFIIHGGDHFTVMVASDGKSFELAIDSSSKSRTMRFFTYNQGPVPVGPRLMMIEVLAPVGARTCSKGSHKQTYFKPLEGEIDSVVQAHPEDKKKNPKAWNTWRYEVVLAEDDPTIEGAKRPDGMPLPPVFSLGKPPCGTPWRCAKCYATRFKTMCFGQNAADAKTCQYCSRKIEDCGWSLWLPYARLPAKWQSAMTKRHGPKLISLIQSKWPGSRVKLIGVDDETDFPSI